MIRKVNVRKRTESRYQRAPWMVEYRLAGGKRRTQFFPTRRDAEGYVQQLHRDLNPHLPSAQRLRFSELVTLFLKSKIDISPPTRSLYLDTFKRFVVICGDPLCDEIAVPHIDILIQGRLLGKDPKKLQNRRLPTNITINKDLQNLHALFRWGVRRSYMNFNPMDRVDKLRVPRRKPRSLTLEQFSLVLKALPDPWKLLTLLSLSGIRKALLASLKRSQIDVVQSTITIPEQKRQPSRIVPLHPVATALLASRLLSIPSDEERVFFNCKFANGTWVDALKRALVPRIRFHDLRTCVSTWLKQQGISGDVVSKLFGHSTPALTYRVYTDLEDLETRRRAVQAIPLLPAPAPAALPTPEPSPADTEPTCST